MQKNIIIGIAISLILIGCGGSNSSSSIKKVTGKFKDTYVKGLNYHCSSGTTGVTNTDGEYTCNLGDSVEFLLGSYSLGTATASEGIITPKTLYPNNPVAELNVAQLLQSLNNNSTNGIITIPEDFSALDDFEVPPTSLTFDTNMTTKLQAFDIPITLVSEEDAVAHLLESYTDTLKDLIKGKTLYTTIDNQNETLESITIDATATSATWREIIGGSCTGSGNLNITNMSLIFTSTSDSCDASEIGSIANITVTDTKDDYLIISYLNETTTISKRLYFNEAKARTYFLINNQDHDSHNLNTLLAGKTVYSRSEGRSGTLESLAFNENMTSMRWTELVGGSCTGTIDILSVNGMNLTFTPKTDSCGSSDTGVVGTLTASNITKDYFFISISNDIKERIYFNEEKARAYFLSK